MANSVHTKLRLQILSFGLLGVFLLIANMALPPLSNLTHGNTSMLSIHLLMEMFAIIIAMLVVIISWHTFDILEARYSKILVCGFLIVASCDTLHALTYAGMPSFLVDSSTPRAIFFWLMGRTFEVLTMAIVATAWVIPFPRLFWVVAGSLTSAILIWIGSYHIDALPVTFIEGQGVTHFKAKYEYMLCMLNIGVAFLLWLRGERTQQTRYYLLALSSFLMGIGEISFTAYVTPSDFQNIFGHAYKLVAYTLLYFATFATSIRAPFDAVLQSEYKLRESEARYHSALSSLSEGVVIQDLQGRIVTLNHAAESILGLTLDQLKGRTLIDSQWQLIHEDGSPWTLDTHPSWSTLQTGIPVSEAVMGMIKQGGTLSWISLNVEPLVDLDSNAHYGVVTSLTDITLRKETETQLRIAAIAFESQQGMMITSKEGIILRVNRAFTLNTGYTAEEAIGKTAKLLQSGRHDAAFYAQMEETIEHTGGWQGEVWDRRKSGEIYPNWLTISAVRGEDGAITHYVNIDIDISARKTAEDQLHQLAFYDPLTQLPNRRLLLERLSHALVGGIRHQQDSALMFLDLDNFKTLNDTMGHDVGDCLLMKVAERLKTCIRQSDTVARLGGDEFVVMLENLEPNNSAATQVKMTAEKIRSALDHPFQLEINTGPDKQKRIEFHSTVSIGVTLFGHQRQSVDEILKQADLAMYQAKDSGRNTVRFFDPQMQLAVATRVALETGLREAIQKEQFSLHYQPQLADDGDYLIGVEALARWKHPQQGMISPAVFIPLAEETGLILPLGHWVLKTACMQLAAWANQPETAHLTIAVNVSALQFHQPDFVERVLSTIADAGANPHRLKLELTESLLVDNVEDIIAKMLALKNQGVGFSLDDFGTGYSSLSYLKRLPLDQLKIDQSFVRDMLIDSNDTAIAKMIIALADTLGLVVIAEGVENDQQRTFLANNGCHTYQGYLFSKPLPIAELEEFIQCHQAASYSI